MSTWLGHRGLLVALLCACVFVCACGSGASTTQNGPVAIQTSSMWVTLQNQAGLAVTDLNVEVVPFGSMPSFSAVHYRLDNGERHDLGINEFRNRDGTPLDLRVNKPKLVRVRGTDVAGKPFVVEAAWRR